MSPLFGRKNKKQDEENTANDNGDKDFSVEASDLAIPIYLNQQIVFDLLAAIENGFSHLSTIKTSTNQTEEDSYGMKGGIGVSNAFALLGVNFSGERSKEKREIQQTEVSRERVHTPNSLFVKLRQKLVYGGMLKILDSTISVDELNSGDFVEFKAIIRKNPVLDTIESIKQIMELARVFEDKPTHKTGRRKQQDPNRQIMVQMDGMIEALTESSSIELVCDLLETKDFRSVLSSQIKFFKNEDARELTDGEFRVLGKIVRVVNKDENINLLRKTKFSRVQSTLFNQFAGEIEELSSSGLDMPKWESEVFGPALQIIPIAIYA